MKRKLSLLILAAGLLAGGAQAQYTGNNQTNTISGITVDWVPEVSYIVGQTWADDALVIQNGGVLSNSFGYIGYQPGANYNSVLVTGSGSVWSNISDLYVGYSGAGDSLTITNGGTVFNTDGYIGYQSGASNNTVVVTGNGSVWNPIGVLSVGYGDVGNSLTITNGGAVYSGDGEIGVASGSNTVLVSGSGSIWNNRDDLYVGLSGNGGNSLVITNGGNLYNGNAPGNAYIGYDSDSNAVLVTGSGSVWTNWADLYVGEFGAGNALTIANGATVECNGGLYVGFQSGANSNAVLVSGSGSVLDISDNTYIGSNGVGNSLSIINGGFVFGHGDNIIGYAPGANSNTVLVSGSGSIWYPLGVFYVGYYGAGNSLTIASNAAMHTDGVIGYQSGADNNTVLVTGRGSVWSPPDALSVGGGSGAGSSLVISNGGYVSCAAGLAIGASAGTSNNTVVVAGGGSLGVTNADGDDTLFVSQTGGADSLVLNGGAVTVDYLYLLNGANSIVTFNAGTLNSGGTIVTTPQNFTVGDGTDVAVYHLLGGEHSFVYGSLEISSNAFLTGCGDINGDVLVDAGGTVLADCGGTLTFSRPVINNGVIQVVNGTVLVTDDQITNNGLIIAIDGTTEFNGGLVNNGCVVSLTEKQVQISSLTRSNNNIVVQIPSIVSDCLTYQLQVTPSLKPAIWTNLNASQSGTGGVLTFTDSGGATNRPGRFYRIDITLP